MMVTINGIEYTEEQNEERIKLVCEIMCLAYLFQQNTKHCVFIDYSGHVDNLRIQVRESPDNYQKELAECEFYTSGRFSGYDISDDPLYWLKVKRDVLKKALADREIDTSMMEDVVHQTISYAF